MVGPLFEDPGAFDRDGLAARLHDLARADIYFGGSSWKYEGWLGQIYRRERYLSRGKFSRKLFESECLREYAETFPTVCGDFAFYQFPTPEFWQRLFRADAGGHFSSPSRSPSRSRARSSRLIRATGRRRARTTNRFWTPHVFHEMFARPLLPYRDKTACMIFEFGAFNRRSFAELGEFLDRLDPFLAALPPEFRYAVEIRNPEFLEKDYFSCLRSHGVAHVYNAWSKMPELQSQIAIPDSATADFQVCRALLRRGRVYEDAVKTFAPYTEVQDPNPEARESMRALIRRAREEKQMLFLYVNNRLEGNAPATILSVVEP